MSKGIEMGRLWEFPADELADLGPATVIHGDARNLPLADGSVDLIVTSPPYFALRSYTDGGEHYVGQVGSEPTPTEFVDALIDCTREMIRVLKPSGSIWVNLGDSYSRYVGPLGGHGQALQGRDDRYPASGPVGAPRVWAVRQKSLVGVPWRYALRCIDELGLILRAEVIWSKPNGLPESVTDRVRRCHETWFHFVREPRYFSAVDEIRESHERNWGGSPNGGTRPMAARLDHKDTGLPGSTPHVLGKLPGSVREVATAPLKVPASLGVDHFAAFPPSWPSWIIRGWSPSGICVECGEGRRPVVGLATRIPNDAASIRTRARTSSATGTHVGSTLGYAADSAERVVTGYACACTPYTSRADAVRGPSFQTGDGHKIGATGKQHVPANYPPREPKQVYQFEGWTPPPTQPAVVLDPFGGTGTTAMAARALGRHGITVDLSAGLLPSRAMARGRSGRAGRGAGHSQSRTCAPDRHDSARRHRNPRQ